MKTNRPVISREGLKIYSTFEGTAEPVKLMATAADPMAADLIVNTINRYFEITTGRKDCD